jgi:hypothetical protein
MERSSEREMSCSPRRCRTGIGESHRSRVLRKSFNISHLSSKECGFAIRCFGYDLLIPWYSRNSNDDMCCIVKSVLFVAKRSKRI